MNTWNHTVNSIFLDAIEIADPLERMGFIENACRDQSHLQSEVLELLKAHEESEGFLEGEPVDSGTVPWNISNSVSNQMQTSRLDVQALPSGTMLGRYRLERILGQGGMGIVYLANDTTLERSVAIKIPRPEFQADSARRLEREAKTMACVKHRNLAAIHDVGQSNGITFLLMDYIRGEPLNDILAKQPRMSPRDIAKLLLKLSDATASAHASGIVHRDIKPGNIIIDESNEPILMDFGLAYRESEDARMTRSGAIVGTPAYMAPEQLHGATHLVGPTCDIYALGAICYELLAGVPPYQGTTSQVLESLAVGRSVEPPSVHRPNVDQWLEAICLKAISHDPSQRFASAKRLADAFGSYLRGDTQNIRALLKSCNLPSRGRHRKRILIACFGVVALPALYIANYGGRFSNHSTTVIPKAFPKPNVWSVPQRVPFVDGNVPATNGSISGDGLRIVFMMRSEKGQSLYESVRSHRQDAFGTPQPIESLVFADDAEPLGTRRGNPRLSHDGLVLTLYVGRAGASPDLYLTRRETLDSQWGPLHPFGPNINTPEPEYASSFTEDMLSLFWFRPNSKDVYDGEIWMASRATPHEEFSSSTLLGSGVNSAESEQHPSISSDGMHLTFDRGTPTPKIWQASRQNRRDAFDQAKPIEFPESWGNRNAYLPSLTSDGSLMIFTSNEVPGREGFETGKLWQSHKTP